MHASAGSAAGFGIEATHMAQASDRRPERCHGACAFSGLLDEFDPLGALDPFVVNLIVAAVVFHLPQEVVQPVQKVGVTLADGPGQRLVGERFVQEDQLAFPLLGHEGRAEGKVVDGGIGLAGQHLQRRLGLHFERLVGGFGDQALDRLFAGGSQLGA